MCVRAYPDLLTENSRVTLANVKQTEHPEAAMLHTHTHSHKTFTVSWVELRLETLKHMYSFIS